MSKPRVYVLPAGRLQQQLFPPKVRGALAESAEPAYNEGPERMSQAELARRVVGFEGLITGWGAPKLTPGVLDAADRLRIVAHAAGSVRFLLPDPPSEFFRRGLRITSATPIMSRYVAELSLCLAIACLRRLSRFRDEMKQTDLWWGTFSEYEPDTLFEKRVGLVGMGSISWELVRLLKPFACEVLAFSTHADPGRCAAEGVRLVELEELLAACEIVFLLAAVRPDTVKMIGAERLRLLRDGAVVVNTARGALVDEAAFIEELKTGRLWAGLDVTEPEPPAADSPLRTLPNVLLSPHVGGPVPSCYWEMAMFCVDEMRRFFSGEPLRAEVSEKRLAGMA